MSRFALFIALLLAVSAGAFTIPKASFASKTVLAAEPATEEETKTVSFVERGVSVDQDGKSNVWAIEPKMEVDTKSNEEKTTSTLIAVGGLAAFAAAAGVILSNLPDPDQF